MTEEHYGESCWNPEAGYKSWTPFGEVLMFEEGGHRAVELFLLSAAACLNFYLVEYAKARDIELRDVSVRCEGEIEKSPERVSRILTNIVIDADLSDSERQKMVKMCEKACKIVNTIKNTPEMIVAVSDRKK